MDIGKILVVCKTIGISMDYQTLQLLKKSGMGHVSGNRERKEPGI